MDKDNINNKVEYKLANGRRICIEVPMNVQGLLEQAEWQIRSQRRQDRRRHTEYVDGLTDTTKFLPQEDFADLVHRMDINSRLYAAIKKLSEIQQRRVYLYYFKWLTCRQIADREGVSFNTVARALIRAKKKLKEQLTQ